MGNNQSHPPGQSGSGPAASQRGRERATSNTPMDIDTLSSEVPVASGSYSQDGIPPNPTVSCRSGSPEPDLGLTIPRYGTTSRRRRYQESTSTASSSRSHTSSTQIDQKYHPEAEIVASRPSIGRRISSAFSRRSSSRRASPLPGKGDSSASGPHAQPHDLHLQEHTEQTLEAERREVKRERGQRGQGETKRRRISGIFSPTPSRSNSAADFGGGEVKRIASSDPSGVQASEIDARRESIPMPVGTHSQPERHTDSEPVETPSIDIRPEASEGQKVGDETLDVARESEAPVGLPGSPPIVPLTDADPLLDDRLRTLSTIWEVLGSDVARSLPAVATAEAVRRASVTDPRSGIEIDTPDAAAAQGVSELDLASLPALPPSTISLLDDLEADTTSRNATSLGLESAVSLDALLGQATSEISGAIESTPRTVVTPASLTSHHTSGSSEPVLSETSLQPPVPPRLTSRTSANSISTAGTSATATSDGPANNRMNDRRRGRMGGLADRVGGWFGIAALDSARDATGSPEASPRQTTVPVPTETASQGHADTPHRPPNAPQRLQQGAVMIVQGFVQTSMSREQPVNETNSGHASGEGEDRPLASSSTGQDRGSIPGQRGTHDQSQARQDRNITSDEPSDSTRPSVMSRRASEGDHIRPESLRRSSFFGRRGIIGRQRSSRDSEAPSFTDQARMLAGLLSVATAATASSLLALPAEDNATASSSNDASTEPQSGPGATLAALRRRLHNSNANSAPAHQEDNGLESVLRSYMQRAMSGNQDTASATTSATVSDDMAERRLPSNASPTASGELDDNPGLATILPNAEASSFEEFLNNMQYSLIQSLREFNNDPTLPGGRETPIVRQDAEPVGDRQPVDEQIEGTTSSNIDPETQAAPLPMDVDQDIGGSAPELSLDDDGRTARISDGEEGPPRLSFFRMFQFPARNQPPITNATAIGNEAPPTSLIPAVIVGVRSINRDISTINGETATQAPFPFSDAADMQNQAQTETEPVQSDDLDAQASPNIAPEASLVDATDPSVNVPTEHRSRIMRALRALVRRDEQRARQQAEAARRAAAFITHNYVIWVVGGNYPAGHPILTIPHLFTGELSHDDLWALSEALGQHKPPIATQDDIAKAGLQVIKGSEIPAAVRDGWIHDMCLDRCLVCLSDYEPQEDCRVMTCKHAFHVECIDRWLKTGRNSCPACRQAGVKTSSGRYTDASNSGVPTDQSQHHSQQTTQTAADSEETSSRASNHDNPMV